MQGVSKDIQARMELQDNLRRYFGQADIFGGEAFFDDLEKGADFRLMKTDHGGSHVVKIGRGDTGHQVSVDNQRFNKWNAQNKATAAAGTVAPSATRSSVPVAKTGLDDFLKKDVASATSDYSKNSATQINHGWKIHFDAAADESSHEVVRKKLTDAGYDWKYGQGYGAGKNYTVYPQSLERRDAIIKMIEEDSDLSNSILKNSDIADSTSLNMGNQVLSERTTGRFTTGYHKVSADTDFSSARPVDFSGSGNGSQIAQVIADDKGQPNRYIRDNWYSNTDTRSSHPLFSEIRNTKADIVEDIGHLQKNYPEIHELMMGKPGYSSPYGMPIAGLGSSPAPTTIIAAPPAAPLSPSPVPSPSISTTTDDLIEPSVVKKIEDPTREAYDAARAKGELIVTEPVTPKPPPSVPASVDLSKLSDEELAASKAKLEKELNDLDAEAKKTEQILAEARAGREQATSTKPKGPSSLGTPVDVKTQPAPHGVAIAPPTVPPPAPPGPSAPPGPPTTSPTGPTAKIVNNTQNSNLTAREALRGIGEDIKAARKPGQRLLSADGSKAMSQAVTRGIKGSRNLKMLAVGSALGLGGYAANRVANRDNPLDLEG
jgi:hypothetical protein